MFLILGNTAGASLGSMPFRLNHRFTLREYFCEVRNLFVVTEPKPAKVLYSQEAG